MQLTGIVSFSWIICILDFNIVFIHFCRLDKTKFYVIGAGLFTGVTVALYPVSVVKTRLQVSSKDAVERNAFSIACGLLRRDEILGLFEGFGIMITGVVPAQTIFLTSLETTKIGAFKLVEPIKFLEPTKATIANGITDMTDSLFSQAVFVLIDVVWWLFFSLFSHVNVITLGVLTEKKSGKCGCL